MQKRVAQNVLRGAPQVPRRDFEIAVAVRRQLDETHGDQRIEELRRRAGGAPGELIANLGAEQVVEFRVAGNPELGDIDNLPGVTSVTRRNGAVTLNITAVDQVLPALLARKYDAKRSFCLGIRGGDPSDTASPPNSIRSMMRGSGSDGPRQGRAPAATYSSGG